ncbi:MAG TPA: rhomboid family intramembrane serine protease [Tepidisphaeraceae bacterium]
MRPPPPLSKLRSYPVTGGIALLAVAVSVGWWMQKFPVYRLEMSILAWHGQPWRLWTSALPHVNVLHLAFDVYWFWVFGTLVEEAFGPLVTLGLYLVLAAGSAMAEFAVARGGVGLSGVGYGLFAFLWVLSRRSPRFAGVVDKQTIQLFVAWFFICVALTAANAMPVANMAHASGAALGASIGYAACARAGRRLAAGGLVAALLAIFVACATVLRPRVNLSRFGNLDEFRLGYDALVAKQNDVAARYLRLAASYRQADATCWFDLGIAYERLGQRSDATNAFQPALTLQPGSAKDQHALRSVQDH